MKNRPLIKAYQSGWQAVPIMNKLLAVTSSHTVAISAMTGLMGLTTTLANPAAQIASLQRILSV
jgi:hypothetical protein